MKPVTRKDSGGAPSWMVTFADLMALLLTMFVLLLSFSIMDLKRYQHIADAMSVAFGVNFFSKLAGVVEVGGSVPRDHMAAVAPLVIDRLDMQPRGLKGETSDQNAEPDANDFGAEDFGVEDQGETSEDSVLKSLTNALAVEIRAHEIGVTREKGNIVIRFPDRAAFATAQAKLNPHFFPTLHKIADVLKRLDAQIVVSGHTDNRPILTNRFRSNWDLSTARAVSVVHHLIDVHGIAPSRLTAQGFADSRPLASNATAEGQALNRRVEITVHVN